LQILDSNLNAMNDMKNLILNSAYRKSSDLKNDDNINCNNVDKRRNDGRRQGSPKRSGSEGVLIGM